MSAYLRAEVGKLHWRSWVEREAALAVAYVFQRPARIGDYETGIAAALAEYAKIPLRTAHDWIARLVASGRFQRKGHAVAFVGEPAPEPVVLESAENAQPKRRNWRVKPWNGSRFFRKYKERFKKEGPSGPAFVPRTEAEWLVAMGLGPSENAARCLE